MGGLRRVRRGWQCRARAAKCVERFDIVFLSLPLRGSMLRLAAVSIAFAAATSALFPAVAEAHIELLEPLARYAIEGRDTGIKSCPCGLGGSNRTCNVEADGSDPNRDESRALTAEAGSVLTLRFEEYVNHSGRYRVAFDPDGADLADFNENILLDVPDDQTSNTDEPQMWQLSVTLPDMTCDGCTLQLIQAMHGDTANEVLDPAPLSSYYTCIDLNLVAPGTLPNDADPEVDDPEVGDPEVDDPDSDPEVDEPEVDDPQPGEPEPGPSLEGIEAVDTGVADPGASDDGMLEVDELADTPDLGGATNSSSDSGGCAMSAPNGAGDWGLGLALMGLLGLFGVRRRR